MNRVNNTKMSSANAAGNGSEGLRNIAPEEMSKFNEIFLQKDSERNHSQTKGDSEESGDLVDNTTQARPNSFSNKNSVDGSGKYNNASGGNKTFSNNKTLHFDKDTANKAEIPASQPNVNPMGSGNNKLNFNEGIFNKPQGPVNNENVGGSINSGAGAPVSQPNVNQAGRGDGKLNFNNTGNKQNINPMGGEDLKAGIDGFEDMPFRPGVGDGQNVKHHAGIRDNVNDMAGMFGQNDKAIGDKDAQNAALFGGEVKRKHLNQDDKHSDKKRVEGNFGPRVPEDVLPNQVPANSANLGDAILGNLRNSSDFYRAESVQKTDTQAEAIQTIGTKIAERIIASRESGEVRISFNDSTLLRGTEAIISKDEKTGILNVDFFAGSDRAAALLSGSQTELRSHLLNNLQNISDVEIGVFQQESTNSEQNDGRSRQEYVGDYAEDDDPDAGQHNNNERK